jgi:hypothetical protein
LRPFTGVTTANLNKAVKRNLERFPDDFMFQLSATEMANLIFQSGISSSGHAVYGCIQRHTSVDGSTGNWKKAGNRFWAGRRQVAGC